MKPSPISTATRFSHPDVPSKPNSQSFKAPRFGLVPSDAGALNPHLTPRQRGVLALLCEGLSNKLIARRLNISAATVKVHIGCILRALHVSSRLQAVVAARRMGLVDDGSTSYKGASKISSGGSPPADDASIMLQTLLNEVIQRVGRPSAQGMSLTVG